MTYFNIKVTQHLVNKSFFDTIIKKGIKFQISIDDINDFTKIKHFNQSFISLINKFVSNPPEEIYVYFLLSSVLKEQNSLIDKVEKTIANGQAVDPVEYNVYKALTTECEEFNSEVDMNEDFEMWKEDEKWRKCIKAF